MQFNLDHFHFSGMNITHLDLGFNSLRKSPDLPLRKLTATKTLVLDGNLFTILESNALHEIRAEFVSISHNAHLQRLEKDAIIKMPILETLTLNNNPKLTYMSPEAITQSPKLAALDLSNNGLFALESNLAVSLGPSLKALYLGGNQFNCHCSLSWVSNLPQIQDREQVTCKPEGEHGAAGVNIREMHRFASKCEPYILPLFSGQDSVTMGKNVSWLCKALGSGDMDVHWRLPRTGRVLGNGECWGRACVKDNQLSVLYLHPEDEGRYECVAKNNYGKDQRQVNLTVKVRNELSRTRLGFLVLDRSSYVEGKPNWLKVHQ